MPSVTKKPIGTQMDSESDEDTALPQAEDAVVELLVEKVEQLNQRLLSLKTPFEEILNRLTALESRTTEVEGVALKIDLGEVPKIPAKLYAGMTAKDVFLTVLQSCIQTMLTQYPTSLIGNKPMVRRRYLADALDLAAETTYMALEKLPGVSES